MQNFAFTRKLVEPLETETKRCERFVICTSTFHMKRSFMLALHYLNGYRLACIHTNEIPTKEQSERESMHIEQWLEHTVRSCEIKLN